MMIQPSQAPNRNSGRKRMEAEDEKRDRFDSLAAGRKTSVLPLKPRIRCGISHGTARINRSNPLTSNGPGAKMFSLFDLAILNCGELLTAAAPEGPKRGGALADLGLIRNGAVGIHRGRIAWVGTQKEYGKRRRAKR